MDQLLNTREAAKRLNLSEITLRRWRLDGSHPNLPYLKLGRAVRYDPQAVASFIAGSVRENTSQGERA